MIHIALVAKVVMMQMYSEQKVFNIWWLQTVDASITSMLVAQQTLSHLWTPQLPNGMLCSFGIF